MKTLRTTFFLIGTICFALMAGTAATAYPGWLQTTFGLAGVLAWGLYTYCVGKDDGFFTMPHTPKDIISNVCAVGIILAGGVASFVFSTPLSPVAASVLSSLVIVFTIISRWASGLTDEMKKKPI